MSTLHYLKEMKSKLTAQECDFLIDVLMAVRDGKIEHSAETYGVNTKTVVTKLGAQADLLDGIQNEYND